MVYSDYSMKGLEAGFARFGYNDRDTARRLDKDELRFGRGELADDQGKAIYGTAVNGLAKVDGVDGENLYVKTIKQGDEFFTYVLDKSGEEKTFTAYHTDKEGKALAGKPLVFAEGTWGAQNGVIELTTEEEQAELDAKAERVRLAREETRLANNATLGQGEVRIGKDGFLNVGGMNGANIKVESSTGKANLEQFYTGDGKLAYRVTTPEMDLIVSTKSGKNGKETTIERRFTHPETGNETVNRTEYRRNSVGGEVHAYRTSTDTNPPKDSTDTPKDTLFDQFEQNAPIATGSNADEAIPSANRELDPDSNPKDTLESATVDNV